MFSNGVTVTNFMLIRKLGFIKSQRMNQIQEDTLVFGLLNQIASIINGITKSMYSTILTLRKYKCFPQVTSILSNINM